MNSVEKGTALENVVQLLEETLNNRGQDGSKRKVEVRKHLTVDEAKYEIDVWVEEFHPIYGNQIYIYECKNWKKPVGRRELADFEQKIRISGAARGFFVAPKFTRDFENMAKKNRHVDLLKVGNDYAKCLDHLTG